MTAVDIKDTDLMQNKKEESDAIGLMSIVNDVFTVMFNEFFFFCNIMGKGMFSLMTYFCTNDQMSLHHIFEHLFMLF